MTPSIASKPSNGTRPNKDLASKSLRTNSLTSGSMSKRSKTPSVLDGPGFTFGGAGIERAEVVGTFLEVGAVVVLCSVLVAIAFVLPSMIVGSTFLNNSWFPVLAPPQNTATNYQPPITTDSWAWQLPSCRGHGQTSRLAEENTVSACLCHHGS